MMLRSVAASAGVLCGSAARFSAVEPLRSRRRRSATGSCRWLTTDAVSMRKLLVDVDCGVDDAQALMLALAAPGVQLLAVTCVHGNTCVENVCRNTLRVLQACDRLEVPVFKGSAHPLLGGSGLHAGHFHGRDGLGDAPDADAPGLELLQPEHAVSAMIRIVGEHPGEVSLVATAPLTNLALAVRMDPSFPSKLRGLYIMGGNTEGQSQGAGLGEGAGPGQHHSSDGSVSARGNSTVCAEFNFAADPEAAFVVLNDFLCPTYLACWEFTCYSKLSWDFCSVWLNQQTPKAAFMRRIFAHSMAASLSERGQKELVGGSGFVSCDSYAMAAAVDDTFITESESLPVSVELTGTHTRGMMVLDRAGLLNKRHHATIIRKVDMDKFQQMMMAALK